MCGPLPRSAQHPLRDTGWRRPDWENVQCLQDEGKRLLTTTNPQNMMHMVKRLQVVMRRVTVTAHRAIVPLHDGRAGVWRASTNIISSRREQT